MRLSRHRGDARSDDARDPPRGVVAGAVRTIRTAWTALPPVVHELPDVVVELRDVLRELGRMLRPGGELSDLVRAVTRLADTNARAIDARLATEPEHARAVRTSSGRSNGATTRAPVRRSGRGRLHELRLLLARLAPALR